MTHHRAYHHCTALYAHFPRPHTHTALFLACHLPLEGYLYSFSPCPSLPSPCLPLLCLTFHGRHGLTFPHAIPLHTHGWTPFTHTTTTTIRTPHTALPLLLQLHLFTLHTLQPTTAFTTYTLLPHCTCTSSYHTAPLHTACLPHTFTTHTPHTACTTHLPLPHTSLLLHTLPFTAV